MKTPLTLLTAMLLAQLASPAAEPNAKPAAAPAYAASVPKPTFSEVRYGTHERQVLDFWKAESPTPTPVVFVIHGGGWRGGAKEIVHRSVDVTALLKAGISVAAINYRFIQNAEAEGVKPPVKAPLHDAARALQLVRSKAAEWNIDKNRIGATGGSAGACSSLWLAFHDDLAEPNSADLVARESTRLSCAAVIGAQTTLDPQQMNEWTPNSKYGGHAFGFSGFPDFLAGRETILPWIAEYSPYALVSKDDPGVYLTFSAPPALGQDQKDPTHTANFGVKLQEHCKAIGVSCELKFPGAPDVKHETPTAFLIAKLTEQDIFEDTTQTIDKRVSDLISKLTLEEKAMLLDHKGPTVERFNIRSDQWNQCLNGVKWDRPTTLFPICVAMAATWNTNLVKEVADVLSDEARAIYNGWHLDPNAPGEHKGLIYRAPVINIGRNPYWGRNHEAWGEDPFLTGRMAVAYVQGLQGSDPRYLKTAATLKHYAVNNVEENRTALDAKVSEAMLRDYWLPHFRDAVVEGKAQSLMASYNAINHTPNNINHWLLTDLLKKEWQHEGFVVSDLGGVKTMVSGHARGAMTYVDAVAKSVMAGCDFSDKEYRENIPAAVREGKLTEERLDDALSRVLRVRFRLGEFDPFGAVPFSQINPNVVNCEKHRATALKAARESIVLLQNRNELLPLDRAKVKRIAVIGSLADRVVLNNYNGAVPQTVTLVQGLKNRVGNAVEVLHEKGCGVTDGGMVATRIDKEDGFSSRASVKLDAQAVGEFIEFTVPVKQAGEYEVKLGYKSFPARGIYQLSISGNDLGKPADFYEASGRYGQTVGFGTVKLKAGNNGLRFTVIGKNDASTGYTGHFDKLTLTGRQELSLEVESLKWRIGGGSEADRIAKAAKLAQSADIAIVCVGTDALVEEEGRDRKTLGLTGSQDELVKAVLAANPRTIVVQMSASPLTVPWLKEHAPAMLQAWWGGEEGGHALADVIFGDVNPAGRLPHTVYASESQVPPQDEYDIRKGFTYMYLKGEPLYGFGHGLSYTTFAYSDIKVEGKPLTVIATVKNIGTRAGDEVAQLYLTPPSSDQPRPNLMLRGFQRLSLQPGESKTVRFQVADEKLAFWNAETKRSEVPRGNWNARIGSSSVDIRVSQVFER